MDIATVVVSSLRAIRRHPRFLVPALFYLIFALGISAVLSSLFLSAIPGHVAAQNQLQTRVGTAFAKIAPIAVVIGVILFLVGIAVKGTYISMVQDQKRLKKLSIRRSFEVAVSRYWSLFAFEVISVVAELVVAAIFLVPLIYLAEGAIIYPYLNKIAISGPSFLGFSAAALVLLLLYFIFAIIVTILLWLGSSIVVIEGSGAAASLKRAVAIGKSDFMRIFGTLAIAYLISAIALLVSRAFQIIPVIGVLVSLIITIGIMAFVEVLAPMYYLDFHKKAQPRQRRRIKPAEQVPV